MIESNTDSPCPAVPTINGVAVTLPTKDGKLSLTIDASGRRSAAQLATEINEEKETAEEAHRHQGMRKRNAKLEGLRREPGCNGTLLNLVSFHNKFPASSGLYTGGDEKSLRVPVLHFEIQ